MGFGLKKLAPFLFLFMWSSGAVMVKVGLQYASVWSFLAARSIVSMCCLALLFWPFSHYKPSLFRRPSKQELIRILTVGTLLQVCYLSFYFLAIDTGTSPGLVTLILGLQPLLTPFLCGLKVSRSKSILLALGFLGLVISICGSKDVSHLAIYGVLFSIIGMLSISYGTVLQANIGSHILQSMLYQSFLSATVFMVIRFFVGGNINWTPGFFISLIWMSLVVSVGSLFLLMYMARQDGAASASILFYAIPLLAYLFDYILFDTRISVLTIVGMLVVALSIIFYRRSPEKSTQ